MKVTQFKPTWELSSPEKILLFAFRQGKSENEVKAEIQDILNHENIEFRTKVDYENLSKYFDEYIALLKNEGFIY